MALITTRGGVQTESTVCTGSRCRNTILQGCLPELSGHSDGSSQLLFGQRKRFWISLCTGSRCRSTILQGCLPELSGHSDGSSQLLFGQRKSFWIRLCVGSLDWETLWIFRRWSFHGVSGNMVAETSRLYISFVCSSGFYEAMRWHSQWWWLFPRMQGFWENVWQFIPRLRFSFLFFKWRLARAH